MKAVGSRTRAWFLVVLVLAFAVRALLVFRTGERALVGDETSYDNIALNLATGHGYQLGHTATDRHPTASRGPSYVYLVAAFYRLAGHRVVPPLVGQCVLEVASCLLVFWIARKTFASDLVGLFAAAIYAVYPPFITSSAALVTEVFTNLVVLAAFAAFLNYVQGRRTRDLVLTGIAIGLGALNKPQLVPIGLILPIAAAPALGWRQFVRSAALVLVVISLVMAPWMVRNVLVFHTFIPGVTHGGIAFWGGTAPFSNRFVGGLGDPWVPESFRQFIGRLSEVEQNRWFVHDALRIITADPWRYARLCFRKFFQLWLNLGYDTPPSRASYALALAHLGAYGLAILAALKARPIPYAVRAMIFLWVFWTITNVLVCTVVRYAMPYYALLFCFTAAGVVCLLSSRKSTRAATVAPMASARSTLGA